MPKRSSLDPHIHPAAAFGAELRQVRERAGFRSRAALAKAMGYTLTTIGKAESGHALPSDTVFSAWMEACKVPPDHREKLATDLAYVRVLPGAPQWFRPWVEVEREADLIRIWCPMLMPGLL
jgi:transcriptional regulator with XRE-family HTH domain